jgi:cyclin L
LTVYAYLLSPTASPLHFINANIKVLTEKPNAEEYSLSEGTYLAERLQLQKAEADILRFCAFDIHVALPHSIALTYLQTLGASSPALAKRVFEHLNAALFSPQLLYATHQPNALAVAAIYLAAREVGVKLVEQEWWEVFDVDREDLGFLVVAMGSMHGFAKSELDKLMKRPVPMTVAAFEEEFETRKMMERGE